MGLEPMTSSLPRTRSTTELQQPTRANEFVAVSDRVLRGRRTTEPGPGGSARPRHSKAPPAGDTAASGQITPSRPAGLFGTRAQTTEYTYVSTPGSGCQGKPRPANAESGVRNAGLNGNGPRVQSSSSSPALSLSKGRPRKRPFAGVSPFLTETRLSPNPPSIPNSGSRTPNPALCWSGRWGSNPQPSAWKAEALPIELRPRSYSWWAGEDSNLRRHCQQIYSLSPLAAREPALPVRCSGARPAP